METFTFEGVELGAPSTQRLIVSNVPLRGPGLEKAVFEMPGHYVYTAPAECALADLEAKVRLFLLEWEESDALPSAGARDIVRLVLGYERIDHALREIHGAPRDPGGVAPGLQKVVP